MEHDPLIVLFIFTITGLIMVQMVNHLRIKQKIVWKTVEQPVTSGILGDRER